MLSMVSALKKRVQDLVEELPEAESSAAQRYLEFLREKGADPYAYLDNGLDLDEEDRKLLNASIKRGLEQARQGLGRPAEEVIAELRRRG